MKERVTPVMEETRSDDMSDFISNALPIQRRRLLDYLKTHGSITTIKARSVLDILHPAGRIEELRAQGYVIDLIWVHVPTESGRLHRVGEYFLQPGSIES